MLQSHPIQLNYGLGRWLAVNCRQLVTSIFCHQYGNFFQDMGDWVSARSYLDSVPFFGLLVRILACKLVKKHVNILTF